MCKDYAYILSEANNLMKTFTISYNVVGHRDELYSSTYDELSGWVRKALKCIENGQDGGRDSNLYLTIRKFRGRSGDINLNIFKSLVHDLEMTNI